MALRLSPYTIAVKKYDSLEEASASLNDYNEHSTLANILGGREGDKFVVETIYRPLYMEFLRKEYTGFLHGKEKSYSTPRY